MADIQELLNMEDFQSSEDFRLGPIGKRKNKKSILDDLQQITTEQSNIQQQIVIPQSFAEQLAEQTIQQIQLSNNQYQKTQQFLSEKRNRIDVEIPQKIEEAKQLLQEIRNDKLPENINVIKIEKELDIALENIPKSDNISIADVNIVASKTEKTKAGYFKTKVSINVDGIPKQINDIASYVKTKTKGLIKPRVCDLRVIGNTNKTQLKNSSLKLTQFTIVFKPDHLKLKVNRGTRIMLSIPEDYSSTGNLYVYIQESRNKKLIETASADFVDTESYNKFIGNLIADFYTNGYEITLKKLLLKGTSNPLMDIATMIIKTNDFTAKPYTSDNHVYAIDFKFKDSSKNSWLFVHLTETDIPGRYDIFARNSVNPNFEYRLTDRQLSFDELNEKLYSVLLQVYNMDWTDKLRGENSQQSDERIYYLLGKLKHSKLKKALNYLSDMNIHIAETLSTDETAKRIEKSYDAESIVGKTDSVDYFILTYLAYKIHGGDKRGGREYITTEEYKAKYNIKTDKKFQDRSKIITTQKEERNYHAREYMFQLEYKVGNKSHIYRTKNFTDIIENTGVFTDDGIKFPATKY